MAGRSTSTGVKRSFRGAFSSPMTLTLEPEWWEVIDREAKRREWTWSALVRHIMEERADAIARSNRSSAVRLWLYDNKPTEGPQ